MILKTLKEALLNAWTMLIEFPLPFLRNDEEKLEQDKNTVILTQILFPFVGLICALLALLLGTILGNTLHPTPASAIFAGIVTYFCVYKDSGRGLAGIMSLTSLKQKDISLEKGLFELPDSISNMNTPIATLTMILVILFKLFAFSVMAFYGYIYWLLAVFVLEFAIEGDLATLPSIENGQAMLKVEKNKQKYIWFIAAFIVLFVLFEAPVASLILFGVAFAMTYGIKFYCTEKINGISGKMIGLAAYIFELFALLLGIILLTKDQVIPS